MKVLVIGNNNVLVNWLAKRFHVVCFASAGEVLKRMSFTEDIHGVVYQGGADISPTWYSQKRHKQTRCLDSTRREDDEAELYWNLVSNKSIPHIGICRGAQFLAVNNGADMYQHCEGHTDEHLIVTADPTSKIMTASSTHHQMVDISPVRSNEDFRLIAWAEDKATGLEKMPKDDATSDAPIPCATNKDPEIFEFKDTATLCIQGHPEYTNVEKEYSEYCLDLIEARVKYFKEQNETVGA